MNDLPLISIIVPVYNVENVLHYCVDSLINQDYKNIEVILVDDGSTDSSGTVCDEYSKKFSNVVVTHKTNGGQSSARNCGLKLAKGSYIGFIDSDDYIDKEMFSLLLHLIKEYDADVASIGCKLVDRYEKQNTIEIKKPDVYDGNDIIKYYLIRGARIGDYSVCKCLFKKECLAGISFRDGFIYEDLDYKFMALLKCKRFVVSETPLYFYVQSQASTSLSPLKRRDFQLIDAVNVLFDLVEATNYEEAIFYAKIIKSRAPFSILCRIAYLGFSDDFSVKSEKRTIIKSLTHDLRHNYFLLMRSPLPFSRKIACTLLCINYVLLKIPMRIVLSFKRKKVKLTH